MIQKNSKRNRGSPPTPLIIESNVIHILAYKVKYSQINEGLICFLQIQEYIYFLIIWFNCEQHGKNQQKEKEKNKHRSKFKVLR